MAHFITVDGIDGVGKSTQIESLRVMLDELSGKTVTIRDPGSTPIGAELRSLLLNSDLAIHRRTEAMLFMASRCEMIESIIRPELASGTNIISDRFLLATVVYQSLADSGDESGCDPDFLWQLGELANGGLRPDLTLLLDMPAERALQRLNAPADRMESRGVDYMESVRQRFIEQLPRSSRATVIINADQTLENVEHDVRVAVQEYLEYPSG